LDKNVLAQEAMEWTMESNQELLVLLLNFKKAIDHIEWGLLFQAVEKLGFN
jgi:hypothetical protein